MHRRHNHHNTPSIPTQPNTQPPTQPGGTTSDQRPTSVRHSQHGEAQVGLASANVKRTNEPTNQRTNEPTNRVTAWPPLATNDATTNDQRRTTTNSSDERRRIPTADFGRFLQGSVFCFGSKCQCSVELYSFTRWRFRGHMWVRWLGDGGVISQSSVGMVSVGEI